MLLFIMNEAWRCSPASSAELQRFKRRPAALLGKVENSTLCKCVLMHSGCDNQARANHAHFNACRKGITKLFTTPLRSASGVGSASRTDTGPQCPSVLPAVLLKQLQQRLKKTADTFILEKQTVQKEMNKHNRPVIEEKIKLGAQSNDTHTP